MSLPRCRVCGRALRDPESIRLGGGPVCVPRTSMPAAAPARASRMSIPTVTCGHGFDVRQLAIPWCEVTAQAAIEGG